MRTHLKLRKFKSLSQLIPAIKNTLGASGVFWGFIELSGAMYEPVHKFWDESGWLILVIVCFLFACSIYKEFRIREAVSFRLGGTTIDLTIKFADIFREEGDYWVPVNEFFDGELGERVSSASVHGGLLTSVYGGDSKRFYDQTAPRLAEERGVETDRLGGNSTKYPIGTTIRLQEGSRNIFLTAFTHTDLVTNKSSADLRMVWTAVLAGMRASYTFGGPNPLLMPLVGAGRSATGIQPKRLIGVIIEAILAGSNGFNKSITICLHSDMQDQINLDVIAKDWTEHGI